VNAVADGRLVSSWSLKTPLRQALQGLALCVEFLLIALFSFVEPLLNGKRSTNPILARMIC
jgi:hypothetical protein